MITHVLGRLEVLGAGLVELGLVLLENGVQDHLAPAFIKAQQRSSSVRRCKATPFLTISVVTKSENGADCLGVAGKYEV